MISSYKEAMKQQLRVVMKKYGKIAAAFHASMFAATFGASYGVIRSGVDVETFLDRIPMVDARKVDASAGSLACAYIATLATGMRLYRYC